MSKASPAQPRERITVWDLSPPWWRRTRFVQRLRHWLGRCEGTGMVQGPECRYCFIDLCRLAEADLCRRVETRRIAAAKGDKAR